MQEFRAGAAGVAESLVATAREAASRAYAPYSGVSVGAAIRSASGRVYAGCNAENAAYPLGHCAETAAIAQAVLAEGPGLRIAEVAVWGRTAAQVPLPISPCGGCRQRIREHAADGAVAVHFPGPDGSIVTMTIDDLLPQPFLRCSLPPHGRDLP
ncbi:MAG: cytidine deaminase [Steroidobacteraceae bacterium]|nr:cytidine deaminase [Steroidobacteraceae bacterium]